jgi:hypothetical protein
MGRAHQRLNWTESGRAECELVNVGMREHKQAGKGEGQEKGVAGDDIMVDWWWGCRDDAVPACPAPAPMCFPYYSY